MGEAKFIVVAVIFSLSLVFSIISMATDYWYQFENLFGKNSKGLWKQCLYTQGIVNVCTPTTDVFMKPVKSLAVCAGVCVLGALISVILSRVMKERALIFLVITAVSGGLGTILIVAALLMFGLKVPGLDAGAWTGITVLPFLGWSYYLAAVHACLAFLGTVMTIVIIVVGLVMGKMEEAKGRQQPANRHGHGPPLPSKQRR